MDEQAQSLWMTNVRDEEQYIDGMIVSPIRPHMIEAAARLQLEPTVAPEDFNFMDLLQKAGHKEKRRTIIAKARLLSSGVVKVTEENLDEYLNLADQCIRYLNWTEDSPFEESEKDVFIMFLAILIYPPLRPADQCTDERIISLWKKVLHHILDGGLPEYMSKLWKQLEAIISRFSPEVTTAELWDGLLEEENIQVKLFQRVLDFLLTATPEVDAPDIWRKLYYWMFPYVIKCLESILLRNLITIPANHPQLPMAVTSFSIAFNSLKIKPKELSLQTRQHIAQIFKQFIHSPSITSSEHVTALQVLSECFTVSELMATNGAEINIGENAVIVMIEALSKTLETGIGSFDGVDIIAYDLMEPIKRLILSKENMKKFLEYDKEEEKDMITLVQKGIKSKDIRIQKPSLEVLKKFCEDETALEQINTDRKLLEDLDVARCSPKQAIAQLSTEVLYEVRIRRPVAVKRKRLEKSSCVKWTDTIVRRKMFECGYDVPQNVDTTGFNGRELLELIMLRRENPPVYYDTIKVRFNLPADLASHKFNVCLGKLEQIFLSEDLSVEPTPDESMSRLEISN